MNILREISELLQKGRAKEIKDAIYEAIKEGYSARQILEKGLMHGMRITEAKFSHSELFVPDMLIGARAMNAGLDVLKPYFTGEAASKKGTVLLGTVKGDLHDIGKNLVKLKMENKGLEVIDLGIDVPREKFIELSKKIKPEIVALSALLTTTMMEMPEVIKAFKNSGLRSQIKIMIGGAPVTDRFKVEIEADLYAPDASQAANIAIAACI